MLPYIPEARAADLLGLTPEEFRARAPSAGILPVALMGAILYRLADIQEAADRAWRQSSSGVTPGSSTGPIRRANTARASAQLPRPKPRHSSPPIKRA
jgi:hypothetical protein